MLSIIQSCYYNEHLATTDYETILAKHKVINFVKGSYILQQTENLNGYYILLQGTVHSFVSTINGNLITLNLYTPNDFVIDVNAIFQRKQSVENWQCLTNCTLLNISLEDFQELFHNIYGFREWGRMWMAQELFKMKELRLETLTLSAKQRYQKLIIQKPHILNTVPLKHIASYLGITDTSLSRIRKELKNK